MRAGLQQIGAIDHAQHLLHVLLDDQHGQAAARECVSPARKPAAPRPARARRTARPAAAASGRTSARGRSRTSAARRRTWCRPSGGGVPSCAETDSKTKSSRSAYLARASGMKAPICRLSSTVSRGNSRRFSGTCAMPRLTMRCAGVASTSVPSMRDRARGRPDQAGDHPHQRGLAGAVGSDHADRFAGVDFEIDAEQRLEGAVARIDRVELKHAQTPPGGALARPRPGSRRRRCRDRPR